MLASGKHMRTQAPAADRGTESPRASRRAVAACLAVALLIVVAVCVAQTPKYAMPDDFMQDLYARGAYFDTPGFLMLYSLVAFSAPLSGLYALLPAVPWYPVALLGLIVVSFATMGVVALSVPARRSLRAFLLCALALCELMVTVYLTYTIVAFVAFAAGVALVLRRAAFTRPTGFRASDVLAFALVIEGFSLRPESGLAACALFSPFLVWALARNRNLRTMLMAAGVVGAMAVSYVAGMVAWHVTDGWESYQPTFSAAQAVADYPVVDYDDVREVAPELSRTDVDMIYDFLFVDEDPYSLETFRALDGVVRGYGLDSMVSSILARPTFTVYVVGLEVILLATAGLICASRRYRGAPCLLTFSVPVLALCEFLVIFLRARLKIHVFLPIFVVALFALVVCCLAPSGPAAGESEESAARRALVGRVVPVAGVAAYAAALLLLWVSYVRPLQATLSTELTPAAESYLSEHDDQLVLFTLTQGVLTNDDVLGFDAWEQPDNAVFIGGYEYYTPSWRTFLGREGLSREHFLSYLVDNDGMVSVSYPDQAEMIATYLSEHTGETVRADRVESLGDTTQDDQDVSVWRYVSAS